MLEENDCYVLDSAKRNIVLMLNNTEGREGAPKDTDKMFELWKEITNEDPIVGKDLTGENMFNKIEEISKIREKSNYIVVIVSTHGGLIGGDVHVLENSQTERGKMKMAKNTMKKGVQKVTSESHEVFYGNDDGPVKVEDVLNLFNNVNAPHLAGIPKFFIFQFCRGLKTSKGVEKDGTIMKGIQNNVVFPEISDMLVAHSTHLGYTAVRNLDDGSWFISKIHDIFRKLHRTHHAVDMLTRVNAEMRKEGDASVKAMSRFESSLTKKFYLCSEVTEME